VRPVREVVGCDDPRLDESLADVRGGVIGALAVEREESAFGGHHDRVAVDRGVPDRLADDAFGAPAPVVDRGVDVVHAGAEREIDRLAGGVVDGGSRISEVGAEPDTGGYARAEPSEVGAPEGVAELVAVVPRALRVAMCAPVVVSQVKVAREVALHSCRYCSWGRSPDEFGWFIVDHQRVLNEGVDTPS